MAQVPKQEQNTQVHWFIIHMMMLTASKENPSVRSMVSEMLCFAENIQIYSDYELEVDPVRKYATTFKLVELNSYFKRLAEKDSAGQQHIVQADTHIN